MSKAQKDLEELFRMQKEGLGSFLDKVFRAHKSHQEDPGTMGFAKWAQDNIALVIKMGRAHFDGRDPWETATDAMEETMEFLNDRIYEFLVQALSYGAAVGFNQNNPECSIDFNKLPGSEEWKTVLAYRNEFCSEQDVLEFIGERMGECGSSFAKMGFLNMKGKETCHVWDLWRESLKSCGYVLFRLGQEAGRRWWDEEVLAGIEKASQDLS